MRFSTETSVPTEKEDLISHGIEAGRIGAGAPESLPDSTTQGKVELRHTEKSSIWPLGPTVPAADSVECEGWCLYFSVLQANKFLVFS